MPQSIGFWCQKCNESRYCGKKCQEEGNVLHAIECGLYREISEFGFGELALQVVLQLDPKILKTYFNEGTSFLKKLERLEIHECNRKDFSNGFHEDDLDAIMSLECASSCPLDDDEIRKLVDLIIPRLSKVSLFHTLFKLFKCVAPSLDRTYFKWFDSTNIFLCFKSRTLANPS